MPTYTSIADIPDTPQYRMVRTALVRRYVRRKPTTREASALNTAALLLVKAEAATTDPGISADALVKYNAAARRAVAMLADIAMERTPPKPLSAFDVPMPGAHA
jgi:hypothetical protein